MPQENISTTQVQSPKRGAIPSPRSALAAAAPHIAITAAPPNFITVPKQISMWGNDVHGDCVTAEEAFAKACNNPEILISDNEVISWATRHGVLEGADPVQVLHFMQSDGFSRDGEIYDDGPYFSVSWTNSSVLQSAISNGPVKIGVAANQLETAWRSTGGRSGWFGLGFQSDNALDHCVSLCGYGSIAWLAQQLGVQVPGGINGTKLGYALFTWDSIGIIDESSMLAITQEAWLRRPTTVLKVELAFSGVWRAGSDAYYLWVNANWDNFRAKWEELSKQNLRLVDLESYTLGGQRVWAGVWRAGSDAHYLWVNASWDDFRAKWEQLAKQNLRLTVLTTYEEGGTRRYAGVWRAGSDAYYLWVNTNWDNFRAKWEELGKQNLRLIHLETFESGTTTQAGGRGSAGVTAAKGDLGGDASRIDADEGDGGGEAGQVGVSEGGGGSSDAGQVGAGEGGGGDVVPAAVGEGGGGSSDAGQVGAGEGGGTY